MQPFPVTHRTCPSFLLCRHRLYVAPGVSVRSMYARVWLLARTGESPLRASDDNGADLPIRVNQTQSIIQFGEQCGVERVERFWAVERHECDA
jgi:hypothetical protein